MNAYFDTCEREYGNLEEGVQGSLVFGMNDLIRPALYGASHRIVNLTAESDHEGDTAVYDVVGPVCESSDVWAEGISLPAAMRGDMLAILSAGAYGQVMASRYNLRDLAPAVWLDWNGDEAVLSF